MPKKRLRSGKRTMQFLRVNFNFHEPYQVLVDERIILKALQAKVDLKLVIGKLLGGSVKMMITQCAMQKLYEQKNEAAIELAKGYERKRCGHKPAEEKSVSVLKCVREVVDVKGENKYRYVVASQRKRLRQMLRTIPGVPLLYLSRSVLVSEPLAEATIALQKQKELEKLTKGLNEVNVQAEESRKRKRAAGPNPLSVRKPLHPEPEANDHAGRKRRKRTKRGGASKHTEPDTGEPAFAAEEIMV